MTTKVPVELSSTPGIVDGSNATAITIDSSERVGIGNASPIEILTLGTTSDANTRISMQSADDGAGTIQFADGTSGAASYAGYINYTHSDNALAFATASAEKMRIDSSGRVGIGTSSPSNLLHINSATGDSVEMKITNTNADAIGANIHLEKDSASPADNDYCGEITWVGSNDNNQQPSFGSVSVQMTDVSDGTEDGDMIFKTSSAGTFAERMRLSGNNLHLSGGTDARIQLGTGGTGNAAVSNNTVHIRGDGDDMKLNAAGNGTFIFEENGTEKMRISSGGLIVKAGSNSSNYSVQFQDASGSSLLRIAGDGAVISPTVYAQTTNDSADMVVRSSGAFERSTSSRRYKNTITDVTKGLAELKTLRPVNYKGNNDGDTVYYGLIAEEVYDSGLTEFVKYIKDEDGKEIPDALRYPHMVALCIKAIQELSTELETTKTRIKTLEES